MMNGAGITDREVAETREGAAMIRNQFGVIISKANLRFAKKLEREGQDTLIYVLGVQWAALKFAAVTAGLHKQPKDMFLLMAEETYDEFASMGDDE